MWRQRQSLERCVYKPQNSGATRSQEGGWDKFPQSLRGDRPCHAWDLDLWPPGLRGSICRVKPPSLWYLVTATPGH